VALYGSMAYRRYRMATEVCNALKMKNTSIVISIHRGLK
jgi:hypothetical protein